MKWTDLIDRIILTYNNKLVHSTTGLMPKEARHPSNELEANVNMQLKAKPNRKDPDIKLENKAYIYIYYTILI